MSAELAFTVSSISIVSSVVVVRPGGNIEAVPNRHRGECTMRTFSAQRSRQVAVLLTCVGICAFSSPVGALSFGNPRLVHADGSSDDLLDDDPSIAVTESGALVIVWEREDTDDGDPDIVFARSTDGGVTWTPPASLHANSTGDSCGLGDAGCDDDPRLFSGGGTLIAAWHGVDLGMGSPHGSDSDIAFARSTDGGMNWLPAELLNVNGFSDTGSDRGASLAHVTGSTWLAVWHSTEAVDGSGAVSDIRYARSTDGGDMWDAPDLIDPTPLVGGVNQSAKLACDLNICVAAWHSNVGVFGAGPDQDIVFSRSTDGGASWTPAGALHPSFGAPEAGDDFTSDLVTDRAGNWLVVWFSDGTHGGDGPGRDVFVSRSEDAGLSWSAPILVNQGGTEAVGDDETPRVTTSGSVWLATWFSNADVGSTGTDRDIRWAESTDAGASWSPPLAMPGSDTDTGEDRFVDAAVQSNGAWVAVWSSTSDVGGSGTDGDILIASTCGNGVIDGVECCDLGSANGDPQSGCSASCMCSGRCTVSQSPCTHPTQCPAGEGCCGNRTLELDEQCDDGNLQGGDCCSPSCAIEATCVPPCPGAHGPHLLSPASMRAKLRNRDSDDEFEQWAANRRGQAGDFNLALGQTIDPCTEETHASFFENDGAGGRRILGEFILTPSDWDRCELRPNGVLIAKMRDLTEMKSDPPGVAKASIREKGNKVRFKFKGKEQASILKPHTNLLRFCVRVGNDAGSAALLCETKSGGKLLKCASTN